MIRRSNKEFPLASRPGFTLVELLTVIAIIAVLVALVASAAFQVIGVQQQRTTEITIQKILGALEQQWDAVIQQAKKEPLSSYPFLPGLAGQDQRRQRVILTKLMLKQNFPMTFSEANAPTPLTGLSPYVAALKGWTPPNPDPNNPVPNIAAESGACLYMALKQNRRGMNFDVDSALSSTELGTVTIVGSNKQSMNFPTILDAWGHPLVFFRWPALNPELNPTAPTSGTTAPPFLDPQDPEGTLNDPTWANSSNSGFKQFSQLPSPVCHPLPPAPTSGSPTPQSFFLTPVIVSLGPRFGSKKTTSGIKDAFMSLIPTGQPGSGDDSDNIYSYRLSQGKAY
jgi:prepilin-type N-terminal cleavage/methylation domain-containing protein